MEMELEQQFSMVQKHFLNSHTVFKKFMPDVYYLNTMQISKLFYIKTKNSIQVSHVDGGNPATCFLPESASGGSCSQKSNSDTAVWTEGILTSSLPFRPSTHP